MRATGLRGYEIEAMSDVDKGMIVGVVEDRAHIATTAIMIGGPAVRAAKLPPDALLRGEQSLDSFLIPHPEEPGLLTIAEGVTVSFVKPFDAGTERVTSPAIKELWPPSSAHQPETTLLDGAETA